MILFFIFFHSPACQSRSRVLTFTVSQQFSRSHGQSRLKRHFERNRVKTSYVVRRDGFRLEDITTHDRQRLPTKGLYMPSSLLYRRRLHAFDGSRAVLQYMLYISLNRFVWRLVDGILVIVDKTVFGFHGTPRAGWSRISCSCYSISSNDHASPRDKTCCCGWDDRLRVVSRKRMFLHVVVSHRAGFGDIVGVSMPTSFFHRGKGTI
mmetsp:Transcript_23373/g.38063  ORF Transcript_23373/g.38063 Transcript_23373/m.38063 type:complete len:207 (-) Transcript_23373:58-678(-)